MRNTDDIEVRQFGDRHIAIRGIGRLFYQDGFPISMAIDELAKKGIEVSLLHVAEECMDNGWSASTVMKKLKGETDIDINHSMGSVNWAVLDEFTRNGEEPLYQNGGYHRQRELIFEYLFGSGYDDAMNRTNRLPEQWLIENVVDICESL